MASIGKFVVAGAAATQESTLALANINFDFSLVKMEAPLEYRGLGSALSSKRKRDAEEGSTHVTARKLGALFADDLPHIPNLSRAYGLRVSEIAENPRFNPRGSYRDGPFIDNIGADGTSIWAAATSGRGALAVHLLACLLARVWSNPEAISIWSEFVEARKSLLQSRIQGQEFHLSMVTACQVEIERDRLAEWDASARSWLRTGDSAMKLRQTQLMIIVDNIALPTPSRATVYDEVMEIWIKTMVMADKLIGGMAQSVQTSDDLLGLCAWHIYPDIYAIGITATTIEQKDNLVTKGGLLTIGLRSVEEENSTGISWSMPLAHLRFYGKPVLSQKTIGSPSSRVPFNRGMQVVLGILTSEWQSPLADLANLARFLTLFATSLDTGMKNILDSWHILSTTWHEDIDNIRKLAARHGTFIDINSDARWPNLLSRQAQTYLRSSDTEQAEIARYFALGRRRYGNALGKAEEHPSPHFGLSDTGLYIRLTAPDKQILKLREMADLFGGQHNLKGAIIRLMHPKDSMGYQMIEYATLLPQAIEGILSRTHRRWLVFPDMNASLFDRSSGSFSPAQINAIKHSISIMRSTAEPCGFVLPNCFIASHSNNPSTLGYPSEFIWSNKNDPLSIPYLVEHTTWAEQVLPAKQRASGWLIGHSQHAYAGFDYRYLYGDNVNAAVYYSTYDTPPSDCALPTDYITRALEMGYLDPLRLVNHFLPLFHPKLIDTDTSAYFRSLISFAHSDRIYASLPQAEIDLTVLTKTLCASNWAQALLTEIHGEFSGTISLACAALFDTGYLDLQPEDLEGVLAISSANSIYASEFLFCDPSHIPRRNHLRHVIGNVGKPGLALLLSPRETILREPDLDTWQLVNHAKFDGSFEDNFASTTLHLSLTGYEQRLNTSRYQKRDKEAFYLEAVVQAYDKGTWVADLDLLHLERGEFLRLDPECLHDISAQQDSSVFPGLTSVDNWFEYLDRPPNMAVIRASGNWVARLALAAIPLASKEALLIGTKKICWACLADLLNPQSFPERLVLC